MNKINSHKEKAMHIDTSGKLYEKKTSGIAYKIVETGLHKGLTLSVKFKRELEKQLKTKGNFAKLYAICIYYLIKDDFNLFDELVICVDENFLFVKKYLNILFKDNPEYFKKTIISIHQLRRFTDNKKLISSADAVANSYRKRGRKNIIRRQKGLYLNLIKLTFEDIKNKWFEI